MATVRSWIRRPELAIPALVIGVAVIFVAFVLAVFRPEPVFATAIVAATAAVLGSALSITLGRYFEKQREVDLQIRSKKIPEYENFIGFWFSLLYAEKLGKRPMSETQMTQAFLDWTKPLIMWASDDVILRWGRLRVQFAGATNVSPPTEDERSKIAPMFSFEQLQLAMRRDAGYPDTSLQPGDLLRLWVNDIDRYL